MLALNALLAGISDLFIGAREVAVGPGPEGGPLRCDSEPVSGCCRVSSDV